MEKKGNGFLVICLILCIVAIAGLAYYIYTTKNDQKTKTEELENKIAILEQRQNNNEKDFNVEEKPNEKSKLNTENETPVNTTVQKELWIGDITKIDFSNLHKEGVQYEGLDPLNSSASRYFQMKTVDGKVSVSMQKIEGEILGTESSDSLGYTNYSTYDGFSDWVELKEVSDVRRAYVGAFGQDFWSESYILFLMNDGTIKYDTFINVVKNQVSLKSISGISNIVELYECPITDVENGERLGGAMTTIVVDKYGVAYDLGDYI